MSGLASSLTRPARSEDVFSVEPKPHWKAKGEYDLFFLLRDSLTHCCGWIDHEMRGVHEEEMSGQLWRRLLGRKLGGRCSSGVYPFDSLCQVGGSPLGRWLGKKSGRSFSTTNGSFSRWERPRHAVVGSTRDPLTAPHGVRDVHTSKWCGWGLGRLAERTWRSEMVLLVRLRVKSGSLKRNDMEGTLCGRV